MRAAVGQLLPFLIHGGYPNGNRHPGMANNYQQSIDERPEVPDVVVSRLPQYVRTLSQLMAEGVLIANSQQLGEKLQITPAQIRKDLSYFGRFGKQGRGYRVEHLLEELKQILGLNVTWNVAVVGVGRLGRAILNYPGFTPDGFQLVAALDDNDRVVGEQVGDLTVQPVSQLAEVVNRHQVSIAIVAVPIAQTQQVVDRVVACGVKAILNYAPIMPQVPEGVNVRSIDPVLSLQSMTYYLANGTSPTE